MKKMCFVMLASMMGVVAQAVLIDDFSSGDLSAYTLTVVNDGSTNRAVSFGSTAGSVFVAKAADSGHEQALFLRGDYSLGVGQILMADVRGTGAGWDRDLGIAVGYTATPPGVPVGSSGDERTSYVEISYRSNNQVVSYARNGSVNLTTGQEFSGNNYGGDSFTGYVDAIYIERVSATYFEVGWIQGATKHVLTNNGAALNYTITTDTPGAAVGLYADVRAAITESPVCLDNLRIVPEPSAMALMGLGALLFARKRK